MEEHKRQKSESEWESELTQEQYLVCRKKETEPPFSGALYSCQEDGIYCCVCCDNRLFRSSEKYDSGSGWPSFWEPLSASCVSYESDSSHGMFRVEALCAHCGAHLGHVFNDGPDPTGKRYCINSVSLKFNKTEDDN